MSSLFTHQKSTGLSGRPFEGQDMVDLSERPSRRHSFSFLVRYYSLVVCLLMSVAILPSLIRYISDGDFRLAITIFGSVAAAYYITKYGYGFVVRDASTEWLRRIGEPLRNNRKWRFARAIGLTLYVSALLVYVYTQTDYLSHPHSDTLWLLFLLVPLFASRKGFTFGMFLAVGGIMIASLTLVTIYPYFMDSTLPFTPDIGLSIGAKAFWLLSLSFIIHILVRYLADLNANLQLLDDVEYAIMDLNSVKDEEELLNTLVERIRDEFGYPHVNILFLQPDGRVKFVAAASPAGKLLKAQGTPVDVTGGITEHVLNTGNSYFSNDVYRDIANGYPFRPHPSFPDTQAELIVPFVVDGNRVKGVLDIQANQRGIFLSSDKEVMERIARHSARLLENIGSVNRMSEAIASIGERLLVPDRLPETLQEIAQAAYEILQPSLVVVHEYDALSKKVARPVIAGKIFKPLPKAHQPSRTSIVYRLIDLGDDAYFQEDISHLPDTDKDRTIFAYKEPNRTTPEFVDREQVKARAIVRLTAGNGECVGVMFLNYRSTKVFSEYEKRQIRDFARLAALAIQKAQFLQRQITYERQELIGRLYDKFAGNVEAASHLITSLACDNMLSDKQQSRLKLAEDALTQIKQNLRYLDATFTDNALATISEEIQKIAQRTREAFDISFDVQWESDRGDDVSIGITNEIRGILNEVVLMAVTKADATQIRLEGGIKNDLLTFGIHFDGRGFDMQYVRPEGWANIHCRVCLLGGNAKIYTKPYNPTDISIELPLTMSAKRLLVVSHRHGAVPIQEADKHVDDLNPERELTEIGTPIVKR